MNIVKDNKFSHGLTAIIVKGSLKHYELPKYSHEIIQATSLGVENWGMSQQSIVFQDTTTIKQASKNTSKHLYRVVTIIVKIKYCVAD